MKKENEKNQSQIKNLLSRQQEQNQVFTKKQRDKKLEENRGRNLENKPLQSPSQEDKPENKKSQRNLEIKKEISIIYQKHKEEPQSAKKLRVQQPVISLLSQNASEQQREQRQNRVLNQHNNESPTYLLTEENSQKMSMYLNFQYSKFLIENKEIQKIFYQLIKKNEGVDISAIKNDQQRFEVEETLKNILKDQNLNQFYTKHNSVLIKAVQDKSLEKVEILLQYNFNPNLQDYQGQTSLHHACLSNQGKMIELLLQYSVDLNAQDFLGQSSLHIACQENKLSIVKILLAKEVDVDQVDVEGHTPLMLVSFGGRKYKQELDDIELQQAYGYESIISLVMTNFPEVDSFLKIAKLLIRKGANIDQIDLHRNTSLMIACQYRNYPLAALLLKKGAYLDAQNDQFQTAFMISCIKKDKRLQKLLIDQKADLEIYNQEGLTGYLYLCIYGNGEDVQFLLDQNINIHQVSQDQKLGYTLAKENKNKETLRIVVVIIETINKTPVFNVLNNLI